MIVNNFISHNYLNIKYDWNIWVMLESLNMIEYYFNQIPIVECLYDWNTIPHNYLNIRYNIFWKKLYIYIHVTRGTGDHPIIKAVWDLSPKHHLKSWCNFTWGNEKLQII